MIMHTIQNVAIGRKQEKCSYPSAARCRNIFKVIHSRSMLVGIMSCNGTLQMPSNGVQLEHVGSTFFFKTHRDFRRFPNN
jgi:hypothetical protein